MCELDKLTGSDRNRCKRLLRDHCRDSGLLLDQASSPEISSQVEEKRDMRQAMVFLQQYGISMNLAVKIYQHYGPGMYSVIQEIRISWRTISGWI